VSLNVCVFCASSNDAPRRYFDAAESLGKLLAERGWPLVYGGGSVGLMGELARSVHRSGGRVIGVIPERLRTSEVAYERCDELIVTPDMSERKAVMIERADAFVCLPGAFGTLDELFEVLTLKWLDYHQKAVVLVDTDGFYKPIVAYLERLIDEGLSRAPSREMYELVANEEAALTYLESYTPCARPDQWS
jgi:uncharacterized protein (TIGR00730 family)